MYKKQRFKAGILRDKTMDEFKHIPNGDKQNYPFYWIRLLIEKFGNFYVWKQPIMIWIPKAGVRANDMVNMVIKLWVSVKFTALPHCF